MRTSYSFPKHHPHRPSLPTPTDFGQMLSSLGATDFVPVAGGKETETSSTSGSPRLTNRFLVSDWPQRRSDEKLTVQNTSLKHSIFVLMGQCNQYVDQHFLGSDM